MYIYMIIIIIALNTTVNKAASPWQRLILDTDAQDVEVRAGGMFPLCCIITSLCWQDESGTKADGRGDSAVSKGTTDSGVVMVAIQVSSLPGQVPRQLPVSESKSGPSGGWMIQTIARDIKTIKSVCVCFFFRCASKVQWDSGRAAEPGNHPSRTEEQHCRRGLQHRGTTSSTYWFYTWTQISSFWNTLHLK